jgi:hypothetical protein
MKPDRVSISTAAKELHMSPQTVRILMASGQLPIGDCARRKGCRRMGYYVYRKLLDQEKEKRGIA